MVTYKYDLVTFKNDQLLLKWLFAFNCDFQLLTEKGTIAIY